LEVIMAAVTRNTTPPGAHQPAPDWPNALVANLIEVQRMQLDALVSWQQSVAAYYNDLWDRWACRWAGGVPIDA
jgi:hypothetical protein